MTLADVAAAPAAGRLDTGEVYGFAGLASAPLVVDAVYEGGATGTKADDPLARLVPGAGNSGGFRPVGSKLNDTLRAVVLYTSGTHPDWPDALDRETGLFTYFGDNRKPGKSLLDTPRGGNAILEWSFARARGGSEDRIRVPPFFVFAKANPGAGRTVRFLGVAVPGGQDVHPTEDLVAVWRTSGELRFQNYRATFTILDEASISRQWLDELRAGIALGDACPESYRTWVEQGAYRPLESPRNIQYRTKQQQLPASRMDEELVTAIRDYFATDPYAFEACAIELWRMQAREPITFVATRRSADGGRDAFGWYHVGPDADRIRLEWSLEAKLYGAETSVGVRDTSRLISRLRHREFGVFVTTSYLTKQAYEELRGDQHPVVVLAARDIAELLRRHGHSTPEDVHSWLAGKFPRT